MEPQLSGVIIRKMATAIAPRVGHRKLRFRLSRDVLRHASSGPTAVSNRSNIVTGMATRL